MNEHGWAFFYQPAPPLMVEVGVDGSRTDGLWALLETFPALAEAGDPANWELTDPVTGTPLPVQVASISQLRQMPMLSLTLTADVPDPPWLLTLSWNGQSQTYGMGWGVLQQGAGLPAGGGGGGGLAPLPGPGGGGGFLDGGGDWDWWDLPGPMTPRDPCDCEPYPGPPQCPPDPADRTPPIPGGPFLTPGVCSDSGNCGDVFPPDPSAVPKLHISARESSEEGDHPTWCAQLEAPRTVWYEHFLENEIMLWDMDITKDLSTPVWEHEPNIPLRSDDPDPSPPEVVGPHEGHPGSPLQWNIAENQSEGTPWGIPGALMHEWPRTGRATRHSRIYAPEAENHPVWPWEIHETSTPDITHATGEETHPTFETEGLAQTPYVITGEERRALTPGGDAYGTDWYKTATIADPAKDLFVMVRGKDNPGILAYEMPDTPFFGQGDRAPLTYARGDRAFLSEVLDPATGAKVIDVLIDGGFAKLKEEYPDKYEEALEKVCDWGRVSATYMIDNPPPGSVPPAYQGKWSGDPSGDPDWSAIYEEAVWFVPVKKGVCCEEPETNWPIWVKLQDDQGNWRLASPSNWDATVGQAEDAALQAGSSAITVTVNRPVWAKQYINLHPLPNHTAFDDDPYQLALISHGLEEGACPDSLTSLAVGYEEDFLIVQAQSGKFVCVEIEVSGTFFVNPLDWRLVVDNGDPSYVSPNGLDGNGDNLPGQNPGVRCDFGQQDFGTPQPRIDCDGYQAPEPPLETCDQILLDDALENNDCDNRQPTDTFLGANNLNDLSACPKDGSGCIAHVWYEVGRMAGENYKFRGECLCKEGTTSGAVSRSDWTPSESLSTWRRARIQIDHHTADPMPSKDPFQNYLYIRMRPALKDTFADVDTQKVYNEVDLPWVSFAGPSNECSEDAVPGGEEVNPLRFSHTKTPMIGGVTHALSTPWNPPHWFQGAEGLTRGSSGAGVACQHVGLHYYLDKYQAFPYNRDHTPLHELGHHLLNSSAEPPGGDCGTIDQSVMDASNYPCPQGTWFSADQVLQIRSGGWSHE